MRSKTFFPWTLHWIEIISIHLLRAEQDKQNVCPIKLRMIISIHLLRAEQDVAVQPARPVPQHINPLAPCGARQFLQHHFDIDLAFQSTCSVRSKTCKILRREKIRNISIHLLRAEQDPMDKSRFDEFRISIHLLRAEQDSKRS